MVNQCNQAGCASPSRERKGAAKNESEGSYARNWQQRLGIHPIVGAENGEIAARHPGLSHLRRAASDSG